MTIRPCAAHFVRGDERHAWTGQGTPKAPLWEREVRLEQTEATCRIAEFFTSDV